MRTIHERIVRALSNDEYAVALAPELQRAEADALRVIRDHLQPPRPEVKPKPEPPPPGIELVDEVRAEGITLADAKARISKIEATVRDPAVRVDLSIKVYKPAAKP